MENNNNRIDTLTQKLDALKKQERIGKKQLREELKKQHQRRCYILGEIVLEHLPELEKIIPGNKEQNAERFHCFDAFFKSVVSNKDFMDIFGAGVQNALKKDGDA